LRSRRFLILWAILCLAAAASAGGAAAGAAPAEESAAILAAPGDPYYPLAEEIAGREGVPIAHSVAEALALDPAFLLWVASPGRLSDEGMVEMGLALRDRPSTLSVGLISGPTIEEARRLWLRAPAVQAGRVVAVNAANPSGHIEAQIRTWSGGEGGEQPLTKENLIASLREADYLTFTGHGGRTYLRMDEETTLREEDLPTLGPVVVATGSCNTFRPWEEDSIALAFTRQGAAAYAGFAYSPNEGYLLGEFDGLPFRYTWPGFPIGHAVQVQNQGALQGFAQFPYYFLLGDPRIALQTEAPYQLVEDRTDGDERTLTYAGAPAGVIPVRIPDGARYRFVDVAGVSAAWQRGPFYNARLQMADIQGDKFVLFVHPGGDFTLRLRARPAWTWVAGDLLLDSLDEALLFSPQSGGDIAALAVAGLVLAAAAWVWRRQKPSARIVPAAALAGAGAAALHGLYALARLERVTITSKPVAFSPLELVATFVLVGCAAYVALRARSWLGRVVAVALVCFHALGPVLLGLPLIALLNRFSIGPRLGVGLWNYSLGLLPLPALAFGALFFGVAFALLNRAVQSGTKEGI